MKTLIIDNYDSFTYNLYQYLGELGANPIVKRNDEISLDEIKTMAPSHIVISPGPGTPEKDSDFGICKEVILELGTTTPVLGVCLGHQGIIHHFGGKVVRAPEVMHGKKSQITHDQTGLFANIESPIEVMRYHSLIGERDSFPDCLTITAETTEDKLIMGVAHKTLPIVGIQFHPESIGTPTGKTMLKNFLNMNAS
jgi:anthranilate synthase/aminodeoxychorismate synthase-like glutamine amidotransferase